MTSADQMPRMAARETNAASFETCVSDCIPPDAIRLMWQVFFASRNRGISPEFHFPWIHDRHNLNCVCTVVDDGSIRTTAAALILRHRPHSSGKKLGLIGLVCVAEKFRGLGLSTRLLEQTVELAKSQQLSHLVLWTTKPEVYEKLGFEADSTDMFGLVTRIGSRASEVELTKNAAVGPVKEALLDGAPAFAKEVVRYSSFNGASISVCKSNSTQTLVEHAGPMDLVINLIDQVMPDTWNLNVPEHAPIIEALNHNGYDTSLKPSAVRMTLALDESDRQPGTIPFLDRI